MFRPGAYEVDAPMGYYVHIVGIGATPEDVVFENSTGPHVPCNNMLPQPGQLVTFWRTAERFKRIGDMDWFVSQAAPLRDLHVTGNLNLHKEGSHGSGGYLANSYVEGNIEGGGQQQWFTRNCYVGGQWNGIGWSAVFVGVESGTNEEHLSRSTCTREGNGGQTVVVDEAPLVAEKPFISVDPVAPSKFNLNVPHPMTNARSSSWSYNTTVYPFEQVYVTTEADTAADINAKLAAGLHVVVSPGIYKLNAPLKIERNDQVLLCLGLTTLLATHGNAAVEVAAGVGGVRVAGCILEAGVIQSEALLQWGDRSAKTQTEPSFIFDLFTRIGGPSFEGHKGNEAKAKISIQIDSDDVVADHLWLWRGDHYLDDNVSTDASVPDKIGITRLGELYNANGLVVTGDRVRVYNLAVEHAVEDQVVWSGEDGEVYFFQCEIPYDVDLVWANNKYVSYRVTENVTRHHAYGVGTYSYFIDFPVWMEQGFSVPPAVEDTIYYPFLVKLSQSSEVAEQGGSGVNTTINGKGPGVGLNGEWHQMALRCAFASEGPTQAPPTEGEQMYWIIVIGAAAVLALFGFYMWRQGAPTPRPETELAEAMT